MADALSIADLLSSPQVIAGFRRAYLDSNVGRADAFEQGGFIVRDPTTNEVSVVRLPAQSRDSLAYPVCRSGQYEGRQIVGTFHTHPNFGPEWKQEPGRQDIRLSQEYPETMGPHQFVIARDTVYHIDNEGIVSVAGPTAKLLALVEGGNS